MTFLRDKTIDAELYAYLQSMSYPSDGGTCVRKKDLPSQGVICEKIGIKSPKTYRSHLRNLISKSYVIETETEYILPNMEDIYLLLPLDTLQFILDTITEPVIKIYVYLGQRYKYKPGYVFTQEEIALHLGLNLDGNLAARREIKNGLVALQNHGLIGYEQFYDGKSPRYRLLFWSNEFADRGAVLK